MTFSPQQSLALTAAFAAVFLVPALASAQPRMPDLVIGDDAPAIDGDTWLYDAAPVTGFEPGHVYAVEFWATWCAPCVERLPELDAIQRAHADQLSIIAVSREDRETIEDFLVRIDLTEPAFAVVSDPDDSMADGWLAASSRDAIPMIYLVGKTGRVEWIGHPGAAAPIVDAMLADTWDPYGAESWVRNIFALERQLERSVQRADIDRVMAFLDLLLDAYDESTRPVHRPMAEAELYATFRAHLLIRDVDRARGYSYARGLMLEHWGAPGFLNNLAWFIVDEPELVERDLDLALQMSERANALTDDDEAAHLDTLARVWFERGDLSAALRYQRLAVDALDGNEDPRPIFDALHRYESIESSGVDPWAAPATDASLSE